MFLCLAIFYWTQCWRVYRTETLAAAGDLHYVESAIRIENDNAMLHYFRAKLLSVPPHSTKEALPELKEAVRLDPNEAAYSIETAFIEQGLGHRPERDTALANALAAAPHRPNVAWAIGNLLVSSGELNRALPIFRELIAKDPNYRQQVLALCWRVRPDAASLIADLMPDDALSTADFLELLIRQKQYDAATTVYQHLVSLHGEPQVSSVTGYIRAMIQNQKWQEAAAAWNAAAEAYPTLRAYREGTNLVVNPSFEFPLLNAPLDWVFEGRNNIATELDTAETHDGSHSLVMSFNESRETDLGVAQWVPVEPNTSYTFSAFARTRDIVSADSPRMRLSAAEVSTPLWLSQDLRGFDGWHELRTTFTTASSTHMLRISIERQNSTLLRGRLWLDQFTLVTNDSKQIDQPQTPTNNNNPAESKKGVR